MNDSKSKEEILMQIFKSLDKNLDNVLTKEEIVSSFSSLNLPLSEKELLTLFSEVDKDLDNRISYEEFKFWFFNLHSLNPLDNLIFLKLKAFSFFRHLNKFFSKTTGPLPESFFEKNVNSGLFSINFGENQQKSSCKLVFNLDFNGNFSNKYLKDMDYVILLRFRLEKSVKNIEQIFEEFQKNFKGLLIVAQNLNKKLRDILKELNFAYSLQGNHLCLTIKFSDNFSKFLFDFQETIQNFFQNHQKSEIFHAKISLRNSANFIMKKMLESPIAGLVAAFSDSNAEISGSITKIAENLFEISKEKFENSFIEDILGLVLMIKSAKMKVFLNNLTAEDIENSGYLEFLPESSFFLQELPKFELPKLPIIKKFYQLFGNGFEARLRVDAKFGSLALRIGGKMEGLLHIFDRFFKIQ